MSTEELERENLALRQRLVDDPTVVAGNQSKPVEQLVDRLVLASIGGCSCLTKSPEWDQHDPMCHFRLFSECIEAIGRSD